MDEGSFDEAYVILFAVACRAARRIVRDEDTAEDVAAETLARAYSRWSKIGSYAEAWVTRVAVNLALDAIRHRRREPSAATIDSVEDPAEWLAVQAALLRLPRRQREAIVVRYVLDLDEQHSAQVLGISQSTLHTHIKRALARLRTPELLAALGA